MGVFTETFGKPTLSVLLGLCAAAAGLLASQSFGWIGALTAFVLIVALGVAVYVYVPWIVDRIKNPPKLEVKALPGCPSTAELSRFHYRTSNTIMTSVMWSMEAHLRKCESCHQALLNPPCPTNMVLIDLFYHGSPPESLNNHVSGCSKCQAFLTRMEEEAKQAS